ncbi:MAG: DNA double-strand break repair nuclease NurA [Thermus sp.]|uniref:DNA double-strand break repair nuclease NurA n=1 Tax=Thermus sp. TaxID=275 RepID=UPI00351B0C54
MAWRLYALELPQAQELLPEGPEPEGFWPLEEPWEPKGGAPLPWPEPLYFLDGKERAEGLVAEGRRLALLGCVAAGAVVFEGGRMRLLPPLVRRVGVGLSEALRAGELLYEPFPVEGEGIYALQEGLRRARANLEAEVASGLSGGLLVVDGPVRLRREAPILGYIKTHWARYLPPEKEALLHRLAPGERSPLFRIRRKGLELASWYLRLPLPPEGVRPTEAGLLRLETPLEGPYERLAALSVSLFPALASHPVKDPRAPQNLTPVGGLERELGRRMGRREVVARFLARHLGGG